MNIALVVNRASGGGLDPEPLVRAMEADVTERFLADQRAMLQEAARILQTYGHPSSEG